MHVVEHFDSEMSLLKMLKELDRDISHHLSTHDVSPCHGISAFAIKRLFF